MVLISLHFQSRLSKLSNSFTPESRVPASSRLASGDLELSEEEHQLLLKIKEKKKELRKKERKEKNKNSGNSEEEEVVVVDNSDLEGVSGQDKSFDSLASFTGDVTDKVGNVGDSVKTGVSVSTVGFSFMKQN